MAFRQATQFLAFGLKAGERGGDFTARRLEAGEQVQRGQMRRRFEQRLVFVLSVQFDETVRQVLECAGGCEVAVDEGAASALCGDFASDEPLLCPDSRRWPRLSLSLRQFGSGRLTRARRGEAPRLPRGSTCRPRSLR